jgi:hypothetical protein
MENRGGTILPIAVFVHLGPKLPKHLLLNLERHVDLFPHIETVLIVDHVHSENIPESIQRYFFRESKEDIELFEHMEKYSDFKFRNGFWKYTFLRLFALGDFHRSKNDQVILHIESDVILMPNIPWEKFGLIKEIAWMRVNEINDVAALVYSPSSTETNYFVDSIRRYAFEDPKTTDMFSMIRFVKENENRHTYLPSITADRCRDVFSMRFQQAAMVEYFGGYFDPLALGLWYFGQDPKNTYGVSTRYIDQTHHEYFAPNAALTFENNKLFDTSGIEVFALHVHSKDLALFGPEWRNALSKVLSDARKGRNQKSFVLPSFIDSLRDRSTRAHFWLLLARLPGSKYLRKISLVEKLKDHVKKFFRIEF